MTVISSQSAPMLVCSQDAPFKNTESLSSRKFAQPTRGGRRSVSKGKPKTGGRLRGVANVVTTDCRKEILRGLAAYGLDGEGTDGIAGLVYAAVKADIRNAIPLLSVVTPKQLHAEVMRTNIEIKTIAELDAELERQGLPRTAEIFPLSYRSDADAEPTELELEVEQGPPK